MVERLHCTTVTTVKNIYFLSTFANSNSTHLTTDVMFSGQHFSILAMFFNECLNLEVSLLILRSSFTEIFFLNILFFFHPRSESIFKRRLKGLLEKTKNGSLIFCIFCSRLPTCQITCFLPSCKV